MTRDNAGRDDSPFVIGLGLQNVEARLRTALDEDANSISPTERLGSILNKANSDEALTFLDEPRHRSPWRAVAVAAAAAVVAGTLWVAGRPGTTPATFPSSTVVVTTPGSTPSLTGSPLPSPSDSATQSGQTSAPTLVHKGLPVYYLGPKAPGSTDLRLFREFVSVPVVAPETVESRALAALRQAMGEPPSGSPYEGRWTGQADSVTVTTTGITIHLPHGLTGAGGEAAKLAVQQLVWTAQGVVGKGRLPVTFTLASGVEVAPGLSVSQTYNVPTGLDQFTEISTVWIDAPSNGAQVEAGTAIRAEGLATVFEANVEWQLLRGTTEVGKSFTTADAGAPERGKYAIELGPLEAGTYTLRVWESSAADGSVAAQASATFVVS